MLAGNRYAHGNDWARGFMRDMGMRHLRTNVATTVADGDVLADSTAIIVKRAPDDAPALFCDDGV